MFMSNKTYVYKNKRFLFASFLHRNTIYHLFPTSTVTLKLLLRLDVNILYAIIRTNSTHVAKQKKFPQCSKINSYIGTYTMDTILDTYTCCKYISICYIFAKGYK